MYIAMFFFLQMPKIKSAKIARKNRQRQKVLLIRVEYIDESSRGKSKSSAK